MTRQHTTFVMMTLRLVFVIGIALLFITPDSSHAANCLSNQDGIWNADATWNDCFDAPIDFAGDQPGLDDNITIANNVTLAQDESPAGGFINLFGICVGSPYEDQCRDYEEFTANLTINGSLTFNNGGNLRHRGQINVNGLFNINQGGTLTLGHVPTGGDLTVAGGGTMNVLGNLINIAIPTAIADSGDFIYIGAPPVPAPPTPADPIIDPSDIINNGTFNIGNNATPTPFVNLSNFTNNNVLNNRGVITNQQWVFPCKIRDTSPIPVVLVYEILTCNRNSNFTNNGIIENFNTIVNTAPAVFTNNGTINNYCGATLTGVIGGTINNLCTVNITAPTEVIEGDSTQFIISLPTGVTNTSTQDIVINLAIGGTAIDDTDYTLSETVSVTIAPGQSSAVLDLTTVDNDLIDPDRNVVVSIASGAGPAVIGANNATVTIRNDEVAFVINDPAISKLGFLLPDNTGVTGEVLEWIVTVTNQNDIPITNVNIIDTLIPDLRIDRVDATGAQVNINGQTVSVTYPALNPRQTVQFSIFTTVLEGEEVSNTACVTINETGNVTCTTGLAITQLPDTGDSPFSRKWLIAIAVFMTSLVGLALISRLRPHTTAQ